MINRSKTLAASLLGATFVLGVAVGAVGFAALGGDEEQEAPARGERPSYAEILTRELSLTPAQRESVQVILDRREGAMRQLWQDIGPRFDSLRGQIREEINAVLDSGQIAQYEELERRAERRRGGGERGNHEK